MWIKNIGQRIIKEASPNGVPEFEYTLRKFLQQKFVEK